MDKKAVELAGFTSAKRSPKRLIANIQGMRKVGKTRLALTAKKPVGFISIEIGGEEGVMDQFIKKGEEFSDDIKIVQIRMDPIAYPDRSSFKPDASGQKDFDMAVSEAVQIAAEPAMSAFYDAYYASLANFATTIVDTGSDLWEITRLSNFGRLEKIPQLAYGQMNKAMDRLIDDAFAYEGNLILLHHMKEKWETFVGENGKQQGKPSGIWELAGYGGITKKVQATIELWREDLEEADPKTGMNVKFNGIIIDSRHSPFAMGQKFEDEFTFADIGMALIGGSSIGDWT